MRLYLIRHGQTSWNIAGRAQGHTDIPLNETGQAQAAALGRAFSGVKLDRILSSDLTRAHQTAQAIAGVSGAPIEVRSTLRERSFGEWEGMNYLEMLSMADRMALEMDWHTVKSPSGESFGDVWERLEPVLNEIHASQEHLAIVTHGGVFGVLVARLIQGTLETSRSFGVGNTAVTEFERRSNGAYRMNRYADTSHLADLVLADAA